MTEQHFSDLIEVSIKAEEMDGFKPGDVVETQYGAGVVIGVAEITQKRYTFHAIPGVTRRIAVETTRYDVMYFDGCELCHKQTAKTRPLSDCLS